MYKVIAERKARGVFEALSRGDWRETIDRSTTADGVTYANEGAHWIRIQRGKATYIHAYPDAEKVTAACDRMAAAGIEEAAAPPITS